MTHPEGNQELEYARYQRRLSQIISARTRRAEKMDRDLSLATAREIERSTSSITGREGRRFNREGDSSPVPVAQTAARRAHPSVAGNVGPSGSLDTAYWSGNSPAGYSLGGLCVSTRDEHLYRRATTQLHGGRLPARRKLCGPCNRCQRDRTSYRADVLCRSHKDHTPRYMIHLLRR